MINDELNMVLQLTLTSSRDHPQTPTLFEHINETDSETNTLIFFLLLQESGLAVSFIFLFIHCSGVFLHEFCFRAIA